MPFDPVDPHQSLPDLERGILKYWQEEDTFKRSMQKREGGEPFSFYDGPPFATGLPHYGHILAGTIKDVIPRYQTMRGRHVQRRFGWDCHGLPVENEIEKEHKLLSKKDIESLGVAKFNDLCRGAVQRYTGEWRKTVERMGRWVDMDHDYRTMDPEFMESIWWVFKQLHGQGLIYEGHKPMHVCPRCQTALSNFEVTQGYSDRTDMSVIFTFPLVDDPNTVLLAWTTTPWSLPGNLWLLVGPDIPYVKVKEKGSKTVYILAEKLVAEVFKQKEHEIIGKIEAKELIGKKYVPLFPYYIDKVIPSTEKSGKPQTYGERCFDILMDENGEVTDTEGTGIVHITNSHGEDGFEISKKKGIDVLHHINIDGSFKKEVTALKGLYAKPFDGKDPMSTDKAVLAELKNIHRYFKSFTYKHSYPHCWRCDSPLLNYATSSWFVAVEKIKAQMLESNSKTSWVPSHIKDGRFGKWLEGARDWAISRSRYWGTPLPIWKNAITGEVEVIGSRDELMAKSPERFTKVILARHAESQGNVDRIYQGIVPGTALTEKGKKQAAALADGIAASSGAAAPLKTIYCSPLQRTRETAEATAKLMGATVIIDERLREVEFGEYEGKHIDFDDLTFIRERRAHKMEKNQVESIFHFQGMETWSSIELRLGEFFDDILPKHKGETIMVVTHADLLMNAQHFFTRQDKNKIVHQPYPGLAGKRTYFWDHETKSSMDLHKETVDDIAWQGQAKKDDTVELTLVRHGETDLNKQRIIQGGEIDMPLNKIGKEQAKKTAEKLEDTTFDVIVTSDLKRAHETASIIAKELNKKVIIASTLLRERMAGEWQGISVEDFWAKIGRKNIGWSFTQQTPKDGESFDQFINRARQAQEWILREYAGKRVLVVAHGGIAKAWLYISGQMTYDEVVSHEPKNASAIEFTITPQMRRVEGVLDCWFESGSMPYAQEHFPFETGSDIPRGFPADFIAEGLDQTRGWFYTLTVLSTALFKCPAFRHCIVNGIVLAEDGKKMSKRLKNYPEPTEVANRHGADAVRFALMGSPAVRGEDLRFSEKLIEETVRSVLLPLWNAYRLFVTYANAVAWKPSLDFSLKNAKSSHPLDRWIVLKTQELINNMTNELEGYDLSATCAHLTASIDDLTNWYVRLSRRRLAGRTGEEASEATSQDQASALDTLYRVLLANAQLLAPFCPFLSESLYLNLVAEDHGSIHFTDWPQSVSLTPDDTKNLRTMDNTRTVVTLALKIRADAKIPVRTPLQSVTVALPPADNGRIIRELLMEELNVKKVIDVSDAASIADRILMIDARKAGPRFGGKVQELIRAGKEGKFEEKDGVIIVMGEELRPEEASIMYRSKEGTHVAADHGIVVSLDTNLTPELTLEGQARELVHAIQILRKEEGLEFTDVITLTLTGADAILVDHTALILTETKATLGEVKKAKKHEVILDDNTITVQFQKNNL